MAEDKTQPERFLSHIASVGLNEWPEKATYCTMKDGGAQWIDEAGNDAGFMPFWDFVIANESPISKKQFLEAQLEQVKVLLKNLEKQINN